MSDKPIIFSAAMVNGLLSGRKTQTRRVLKPQPIADRIVWRGDHWLWYSGDGDSGAARVPFAPGDRLWCKEAWRCPQAYDDLKPSDLSGEETVRHEAGPVFVPLVGGRYRHARFMPRWASRLTLIVTDVRIQRLQEITAEDATAEGIPWEPDALAPYEWSVSRFADLWDSLHGPDAWGANPWVVALTFDVHRGNIDQIGSAA